ncbi:mannitol dehydrogenase family protein [Leifsonia poae]|uniref:mannitol dehydrogenase family protein n=1 Tax=Leifsonia poae TaxID=110933 RepID=UPI001CBE6827|nr:mannitol dehydrogenase family protein [Leifsonia poae]
MTTDDKQGISVSARLNTRTLDSLAARVRVPDYDRSSVRTGIVHFGVGGFHRSHQAVVIDDLLARGELDWGICGVGLLPADAGMARALADQDNLYTLIERAPDGSEAVRVVGSIVDYAYAPDDPEAVLNRLTSPTVHIVSLTITEGGYFLDHRTGAFDPDADAIRRDGASPSRPSTAFGFIVEALHRRRELGIPPFTVMSCDNIRSNGRVARDATVGMARSRSENLAGWIEENVAFPNSMVDRITPVTTDEDRARLRAEGIEDHRPVVCEPFFQWVLEDDFRSGRPPYELAGVDVVTDVAPYELMKLRLLNGAHQVLASLAAVAGHTFVHEAAQDAPFASLLQNYWAQEAIPGLDPLPGVDYGDYARSLLERFRNPFIGDTLERLVTDSTNRIPVFLLPVVADRMRRNLPSEAATLAIAGWARYAEGADDDGRILRLHDARADDLRERAARWPSDVDAFIDNRDVFGDLADEPDFRRDYREASDRIHRLGARAAVIATVERR